MNLNHLFLICSLLLAVWALQIESTLQSSVMINVPGYASKLLGTTGESLYTKRNFYAFRSVYYAEKSTNATRFLPPIPKAPYPPNEVVNAPVDNVGCPQVSPRPFGDENCLSLNIYSLTRVSKLPVLFWIHGGSFSIGKAAPFGPERFMEQDIVLVVIQYRLGPLGCLTLGTDDVPGNAGIFDRIEALRWVKKYISNFCGDPNQVTIGGGSAGGEAVAFLLLTPQAKEIYYGMLLPNNLLTNSTFLAKSLVPTLLRMFGYIGINDTGSSLAAAYTAKYLAGTNPNNFTSMIPGLTDLCSVLWIKNATLNMENILADQGSKLYLFSFEY